MGYLFLFFFFLFTVTAGEDCGKVLPSFMPLNASDRFISVNSSLLIIFYIAPFSTLPGYKNQESKQYINLLISLTGVCDLNLHTHAS